MHIVNGVARFSCIGSDCEETCCIGWNIQFDRKTATELVQSPIFSETWATLSLQENPDGYLLRSKSSDKRCPFFRKDKLCDIHVKAGESHTPKGCQNFPRYLGSRMGELELSAQLSCPEMVRQIILVEDGSKLVKHPTESTIQVNQVIQFDNRKPYLHYFESVRQALLTLLHKEQDITQSFWNVCEFCRTSKSMFHHQASIFPGRKLHNLLQQTSSLSIPSSESISRLLYEVIPLIKQKNLHQSFQAAIAKLVEVSDLHNHFCTVEKRLWERYPQRQSTWMRNFLEHAFITHWYPQSPNLYVYIKSIALRLFICRILLVLYPHTTQEEFCTSIVQAIYRAHRLLDHNSAFCTQLQQKAQSLSPDLYHAMATLSMPQQ